MTEDEELDVIRLLVRGIAKQTGRSKDALKLVKAAIGYHAGRREAGDYTDVPRHRRISLIVSLAIELELLKGMAPRGKAKV
jgi:hypothetical protein